MQLPVQGLEERARWVISVRWFACLLVFVATFASSRLLELVADPAPLYAVLGAMLGYNALLHWRWQRRPHGAGQEWARRALLLQVTLDLFALTLLLYFADLAHNPLLACYPFHLVVISILLPGATPYFLAALTALLVGSVLLLQHLGAIPIHRLAVPSLRDAPAPEGAFVLAGFLGFACCLGLIVYFTSSVARHVEHSHRKLRQQEKMLGISQLVLGFAHQINNPLDGLQNCLRQVQARCADDSSTATMLRLMREGLDRIARLARRLQEFARPGGLRVQPMDLAGPLDAVVQLLDAPCRARGVVLTLRAAQVPKALGDPYAVQEALLNLGTNAVEAMPQGGDLSIRVFRLPHDDVGEAGAVAIDVADTGCGIPAESRQRLFEPFNTTKGEQGGTGLGLSLCRMLLAEMGGRIELRPAESRGTTFRVVLPVAAPGGDAVCDYS